MSAPKLRSRNYPPEHGILVPVEHQGRVIRDFLATTAMRPSDADCLAERLATNDARCLFSHGSRQLRHYLESLADGRVNPEPDVRVIAGDGATAVVDGDGGLGYLACRVGMEQVLERTRSLGVGACSTGNHFHIGSAGIWTRMAVERGYIGMAMSAHRNPLDPGSTVVGVMNSSPLSIAFPSGDQPPFILDMGSAILPGRQDLMEEIPHSFFKAMGVSTAVQVFSGILAGIYRTSVAPPESKWTGTQGAFLCAWDVGRFLDLDEFTAEMDRFIGEARAMQPLPGLERAELPGGMEWQWEKDNRERGIPLGDAHRQELEELAGEAGVDCGYQLYEETRF